MLNLNFQYLPMFSWGPYGERFLCWNLNWLRLLYFPTLTKDSIAYLTEIQNLWSKLGTWCTIVQSTRRVFLDLMLSSSNICKEYFPNLLESTLCHQIFVFWVRDLKFWLLAYFLILLSCAKFQQDWTTLILDIL